ncbi:MAG TPA: ATP-binding protein [Anaeromyxobacteraceae bacterium]|nr:ATP-binding protein [Anaeromyxobacteraceae bacterium]
MSLPPSVLQAVIPLGDLLDLRAFAEVCQSFVELYRVGLKVFDADGNKLVDVKVGNADFCGYIWTKSAGREQCMATVGRVKNDPLPEAPVQQVIDCFSGCRYLVAPILYEGDAIGRIVFGPFLPEELKALPRELAAVAPDFDPKLAEGYAQKIRRASRATAEKIVKHFGDLVEVMVFTGHKALITARLHIEAVQEDYRALQEKNQQLEDSFARLKELDRLKSNFLATMSHELRTPLTSVIGYSEMMLEGLGGPLTAEQREYLGIIMEKGENLLQLITSILDISKIEAGRVRLILAEVDPSQLMRDAVATVLPLARKKGIRVACEPGELPRLHCDREKLRQCLVNLCQNAVKFTPTGGVITVGATPEGNGQLAFRVQDTGIGIPPEHRERVFDVFYQVDGSSTREYGGAGLGLAIVKSFIEAHGGTVGFSERPGGGSVFTLTLPLRPVVAPAITPAPVADLPPAAAGPRG